MSFRITVSACSRWLISSAKTLERVSVSCFLFRMYAPQLPITATLIAVSRPPTGASRICSFFQKSGVSSGMLLPFQRIFLPGFLQNPIESARVPVGLNFTENGLVFEVDRDLAFTGFRDDDAIIAKLVGNGGISFGAALNFKLRIFADGFVALINGAVDL